MQQHRRIHRTLLIASASLALGACSQIGMSSSSSSNNNDAAKPGNGLSFFLVSANPGNGANLGGLAGADRYCQQLASSVGAGGKTWRAYLSTLSTGSTPAVNARDRIGSGPWRNAKGQLIARNVAELHDAAANNLNKDTALTEKGEVVAGRGDPVNMHDILTGSQADGTVANTGGDTTCSNWTNGGADGSAIVGHHDRIGLNDSAPMKSWVSSHPSRGCSLEALKATGGNGRFYCFAAD